jgi:UDP-N-acetylmuramate-alanine ligase
MRGEHYHLVGMAGVGMSALAQGMLHAGCLVTGSDRDYDRGRELTVIARLGGAGARFVPQDGGGVTERTAGVVVSTAIEGDNPDLRAARALNVPVIHRAEMLGRLVEGKRCVAVTGTSGKSTVTGMIGWMLERAGADPVVVNGAPVLNWAGADAIGNFRAGRSDLWVIEADESDRSVLRFHPDWAVITNVSKDHFTADEAQRIFDKFRRQVRHGVVGPIEDAGPAGGFQPRVTPSGTEFTVGDRAVEVPLPGLHNAENAFLAVLLCGRLGLPPEQCAAGIASFRGIARRLETVGVAAGVRVVDDYGHNPAKIRAAYRALAPYGRRLLTVWRPHGYGPLALMLAELADAFVEVCRPQDRLWLLPVYDAGGTADRSVGSEMLAARLAARGVRAGVVAGHDDAAAAAVAAAEPGDVVLVMGARDPDLPGLARRILTALPRRPPAEHAPR